MYLRRYLKAFKRDGERKLKRLVDRPQAWRLFKVTFVNDPNPITAPEQDAAAVLGEEYEHVPIPFRRIQKLAGVIAARDGCTQTEAMDRAVKERPDLYKQLDKLKPKDWERREPWRVAEVTAIAAAALDRLGSPSACFAAGKAVAEYDMGERFPEIRWEAASRRVDFAWGPRARGVRQKETRTC